MGDIIDRLDILYKEHMESLEYLVPRVDTSKYDSDGGGKYDLSTNLRFLAACEYVLHGDKKKFLELLSKSVSLVAKVFEDYHSGKITSIAYVKWNQYLHMLDSYTSLNFASAKTIAKYIGNLDTDKKEKGFFPALSYSIKYMVLEDSKNLKQYSDKLSESITQKNAKNYLGYAAIIQAYINNDSKSMQKGFETLLANHKQLCKARGEYSDTEDEVIFLHGLGLINLVRSRGFDVTLDDPLIPQDLLTTVKK
ncbi:hypothetical protein LEP1GSC202_0314 [Leptospira yanagawae serovar Saopaulo str. Sao Paulo = ATCC 700523]|uniref:Uncharacterized protein n=1 Tax=Leptospira yanagawae serovar Saopaulo str. Sao Paulo = ATCC 700523 TaxID=1249483 RepID=A0A5E8HA25_9LEPT|nr:hypothetical protein [Leptospira yanagawae]EOQ87578.1 hypothetical protein LEP1GSC202_0314 [Leptospira yanagawae serovar Saopaulo str. Sao Paulo = ATCC 700523]